jgi:signal transduction histidine kinase
MRMKNIFASSRVKSLYFYYLLSLAVVAGAIFFVMMMYQRTIHKRQSPAQLSAQSMVIVAAAQSLPSEQVKIISKGWLHKGLKAALSDTPPAKASVFDKTDFMAIKKFITSSPDHFNLTINTDNAGWLTLSRHVSSQYFLIFGFFMLIAVLVLLFARLLYGLVRSLAYPMHGIISSLKRFASDMRAPPIAVAGPPELQKVIVALNAMQAKVRQLVEDRTQMLAAISHDLRTPITRLQLRTEFMPQVQREKAAADLIEMEKMINSILSFARDYNSQEESVRIDINVLLDTICDDLSDVGNDVTYAATEKVVIRGRMLALKRALNNLIENAIKYGKCAQVSLEINSAVAQIKIKDQGPGIASSERDKVFRPFYRVDAARTSGQGGSGLGLAVAKDIIRANGGDIQLLNLQPNGLQVTVTLPLAN